MAGQEKDAWDDLSYYELLSVPQNASQDEIKKA